MTAPMIVILGIKYPRLVQYFAFAANCEDCSGVNRLSALSRQPLRRLVVYGVVWIVCEIFSPFQRALSDRGLSRRMKGR